MIGFDRQLAEADVVLTGEGRLDAQTVSGKAVHGVVRRSQRQGKGVLGVFGQIDPLLREEEMYRSFLDVDSLVDESTTSDLAIARAAPLLRVKTRDTISRYRNSAG